MVVWITVGKPESGVLSKVWSKMERVPADEGSEAAPSAMHPRTVMSRCFWTLFAPDLDFR